MASTTACAGIFSSVRDMSVAVHMAPLSGIGPAGVMIVSPRHRDIAERQRHPAGLAPCGLLEPPGTPAPARLRPGVRRETGRGRRLRGVRSG